MSGQKESSSISSSAWTLNPMFLHSSDLFEGESESVDHEYELCGVDPVELVHLNGYDEEDEEDEEAGWGERVK